MILYAMILECQGWTTPQMRNIVINTTRPRPFIFSHFQTLATTESFYVSTIELKKGSISAVHDHSYINLSTSIA